MLATIVLHINKHKLPYIWHLTIVHSATLHYAPPNYIMFTLQSWECFKRG